MVQAAAKGLDLSGFDLRKQRDRNRLTLLLNELQRQNDIAMMSVRHLHYSNLSSNVLLTVEGRDERLKVAHGLLQAICAAYTPWETPETTQQADASSAEEMIRKYKEMQAAGGL